MGDRTLRDPAAVAWASGLFEGEGCIHIAPSRHGGSVRIHVSMTDRDVLERFADVWGDLGHLTAASRQPRVEHHKPSWRWSSSGFRAVEVLRAMRPWLGGRRGAKADAALALPFYQPRVCPECGETFDRTPQTRNALVCSPECRRERFRRVYRPRYEGRLREGTVAARPRPEKASA